MWRDSLSKYQSLTQALQSACFNNKQVHIIKSGTAELAFTYQQLCQRAQAVLFQLQAGGMKPADELIIAVEDCEIFLYVFWACLLGKIIAVPVTYGNNGENKLKISKIWSSLNKPYLVTNQKLFNDLIKIVPESDLPGKVELLRQRTFFVNEITAISDVGVIYPAAADDIAFIQFSSGSTGDPKGVILTHQNLLTNINAIINSAKVTASDSTLSWLPLTHDMGLIGFHLAPLVFGLDQYILPTSLFIRRPMLWLEKAHQYKTTILCSPNFGYKYFLAAFNHEEAKHWDLSSIRLIFNGAEPISKQLCEDFLDQMSKYGLKRNTMFPVYGLAEAALAVTFPPVAEELVCINLNRNKLKVGDQVEKVAEEADNKVTFVDVGSAITDCSIRICDENNNILNEGQVGYIQIKGKNVTSGYYNNAQATAGVISKTGWLNTGDLGFMRQGRLVVTGRAKDIIFINGQNYYPHDIERVAQKVRGIELGEVAAFGVPDEVRQNEAVIVGVLFKRAVEEFVPLAITLKRHLNKEMGLDVKAVIPVKRIPKTTSGKIMRFKLREMYQDGYFTATVEALNQLFATYAQSKTVNRPESSIEEQLLAILVELLGDRNIGIDDHFLELGFDSLLLTRFCDRVETNKIAQLSVIDLFSYPTVRKLAEFIATGKSDQHRPSLSAFQLKLPRAYFNEADFDGVHNDDSIYLFEMPHKLLDAINAIARCETTGVIEILLALFIYHLFSSTEQTEFTVQTMVHQSNQVRALAVDLDQVETVPDLFKMITAKLKSKDELGYSLHNISNLTFNKEPDSIVPFFYREALLTDKSKLLQVYDLTLGIFENNGRMGLVFDYERERLNQAAMKEFIAAYIRLLYAIVAQYKNDHGVKTE